MSLDISSELCEKLREIVKDGWFHKNPVNIVRIVGDSSNVFDKHISYRNGTYYTWIKPDECFYAQQLKEYSRHSTWTSYPSCNIYLGELKTLEPRKLKDKELEDTEENFYSKAERIDYYIGNWLTRCPVRYYPKYNTFLFQSHFIRFIFDIKNVNFFETIDFTNYEGESYLFAMGK